MSGPEVDVDALIAAGLYDPDATDATERLGVLRHAHDAGASVEEMVVASRDGNLVSLATDLRFRRGQRSAIELAERAGVPVDRLLETYRLLAIPVPDLTERVFDEREVRVLELLEIGTATLPEGLTEEVLRSVGSALTVVAESAVSVFVGTVEEELERKGDQVHRAEVTSATGELALEIGAMMDPLFRHHLWSAVLRQRAAMAHSRGRLDSQLAVGFVDLVGFTATTATMTPAELLEFVRQFHSETFDVVTRAGGRVVKHIGDEIMFSAGDANRGCEIALALVDAFHDTDSQPRGGLAHGTLVARHGDLYGRIVNLAARLADVAVPGEVLADAAIVPALGDGRFEVEPAGRRQLKGFTEPVAVVSVRRASA